MIASQPGCEFCRIFGDESRRSHPRWITDLEVSTAIVARNQVFRGYAVLVYNRSHAVELFELRPDDRAAYAEDLAKIAKAVYGAYRPHKMNYGLLGNLVPHLHWHIIPRRTTDPVDLRHPIWGQASDEIRLSDREYSVIAEKIRDHLL